MLPGENEVPERPSRGGAFAERDCVRWQHVFLTLNTAIFTLVAAFWKDRPEAPEWGRHGGTARRWRVDRMATVIVPEQDCPHPNACLTCPDFQTTPEFLDIHRRQRNHTAVLIATAEVNGQFRLVDNHRRVAENLGNIITALEAMTERDRGVV